MRKLRKAKSVNLVIIVKITLLKITLLKHSLKRLNTPNILILICFLDAEGNSAEDELQDSQNCLDTRATLANSQPDFSDVQTPTTTVNTQNSTENTRNSTSLRPVSMDETMFHTHSQQGQVPAHLTSTPLYQIPQYTQVATAPPMPFPQP